MEIEEIKDLIYKSVKCKEISFYPEGEKHKVITLDIEDGSVLFTTDSKYYIYRNNLDKVLDKLSNSFQGYFYKVIVHKNDNINNKDIIINLINTKDKKELTEENYISIILDEILETSKLIKFIQDNFYNAKKWLLF